jgi:hypothetical protein
MKMKTKIIFPILLLFILLGCCTSEPKEKTDKKEKNKVTLDVEIIPGEYWHHQEIFEIPDGKGGKVKIPVNLFPQVAIWITDENDNLIDIIYVSETFGKQKRFYPPTNDKPDETFGQYYFPNFMKYLNQAKVTLPTTNSPMPDSITSATPPRDTNPESLLKADYKLPSGYTINKSVTIKKYKKINIYVELSKMTDNAKMDGTYGLGIYKQNYYSQNIEGYYNFGEPSLIYMAEIRGNKRCGINTLDLIGHGGLLPGVKDDSEFKPDEGLYLHSDNDALERIKKYQEDTGLKIVKEIKVILK